MHHDGQVFQGQDWWPPLLGVWLGSALLVRGNSAHDPPTYLSICYLVRASIWAVAFVGQPGSADWYYWSPLIPTAYFCGEFELLTIPIWCTAESILLAGYAPMLLARGSMIPFVLACISALHAIVVHNPLVLASTAYLLFRTRPGKSPSFGRTSEIDGIGLSPLK